MCIYEILEQGFYLFQQVLGQFRQISSKSACFVCLRPGRPLPSTRPVKYACWTLVREPWGEGQRTAVGTGIQKSPRPGVRLPWFSPSTTTFWLLENYSTLPTFHLTLCKIRAALAGLLDKSVTKKCSAPSPACCKHSVPVGAAPSGARSGAVPVACLGKVGAHFALNTGSSFPAARMTTAPSVLNPKWKMETLQLKGNFPRLLQLKLISLFSELLWFFWPNHRLVLRVY